LPQKEKLDTPSELDEPEKTYSLIDIYGNESRLNFHDQSRRLDETNLLEQNNYEFDLNSYQASPDDKKQ
jgi:hypothetical protein